MTLLTWLGQFLDPAITPEAVRLEIFLLGSRHRGEALKGALQELGTSGLTRHRARLLHAAAEELADQAPSPPPMT